ncbi:MAG: hypothetical protein MUD10_02035 [Candidatus Pacebacteria bacterium]|jgi:hypothetical protein|nr:hypothetical protein [Candidatus Paceibacterota bacterium]
MVAINVKLEINQFFLGGARIKRQDLGFHTKIPHPPRDKMGKLAPEIKDNYHK